MSKAGEEEYEDECFFYESLDRLVSSTASSACCSSDDDGEEELEDSNLILGSPDYVSPEIPLPIPKFPTGVSDNYGVWTCQPSSVKERRSNLLRQMGLIRDPSVSRQKTSLFAEADDLHGGGARGTEFGRSLSSDHCHLNSNSQQRCGEICCNNRSNHGNSNPSPGIVRSRSDGSADHQYRLKHQNTDSAPSSSITSNFINSSTYSYKILSVGLPMPVTATCHDVALVNNGNHTVVHKSQGCNGSSVTGALLLNKPPSRNNRRLGEEIRTEFRVSSSIGNCNMLSASVGGREAEDSRSCAVVRVNDQVCTIRNLDNGTEFVVNEFREDGMWKKLKEVGTGRQLTMEEFEMCVGHSPIVQELMRRQNVECGNNDNTNSKANGIVGSGSKLKKTGNWLKSIRTVASSVTGPKERRSSDERDTSSEKGGRRSSSATDDSQDASYHGPERVRVRQYGKSCKELTDLYKIQEIKAHNGSIWTIKFSLDGKYLASAGEDCIIHVWQVLELERKGELITDKQGDGNFNLLVFANGSPEPTSLSPSLDGNPEKKRRGRSSTRRKSVSLDQIVVPETAFSLSDKPICSFQGHSDDVLDLSWSKSQLLLSSSMDKTVRLWHLPSKTCLKSFPHSDYVTCIQFNPVDDRYFISGSLDAKVRVWSIPDHQVVDWNDLHEMVTAACYTPDGQGALVGSYKGSCHLYNFSDNKFQQRSQINLQNKKKKGHKKKINGFQFAPGSASEVIVTSADSRIRVIDGDDLVHKFKGFRNTHGQIYASITENGKYLVCASEDSHVYVWKHERDSQQPSRSKGVTVMQSYEYFHCRDVSLAIPWPGMCDSWEFQDTYSGDLNGIVEHLDGASTVNHPPTPVGETNSNESSSLASGCSNSPHYGTISSATNSYLFDRISGTWPEEKLLGASKNCSLQGTVDLYDGLNENRSAWGLVIVTAGLRGEIRTFQNFGFPVRI